MGIAGANAGVSHASFFVSVELTTDHWQDEFNSIPP
jgi:hypothetical protein